MAVPRRQFLIIFSFRFSLYSSQLLESIDKHDVLILVGETESGQTDLKAVHVVLHARLSQIAKVGCRTHGGAWTATFSFLSVAFSPRSDRLLEAIDARRPHCDWRDGLRQDGPEDRA